MKPYGVPRDLNLECPDKIDITYFGLKTSIGQLKKKGGDYPSKDTKSRNFFRRVWAKRARGYSKKFVRKELEDFTHPMCSD